MSETHSARKETENAWSFIRGFKELGKEWPRDHWALQIMNVFECLAYFAILFSATLWIKEDLGFKDGHSQLIYGIWIAVVAVMGTIGGFIVDSMRIRRAFLIATVINLIGRVAMVGLAIWAPVGSTFMLPILIMVLFVQGVGQGMMQPLFNGAIGRYSSNKTRGAGYNLWYIGMQVGAIMALYSIDFLRVDFGFVPILCITVVSSVVYLIIAVFFLWREEQVGEGEEDEETEPEEKTGAWTMFKEEVRTSRFWRFMLFMLMILGARMTFAIPMVINPKYYTRTMGEDVDFGLVMSLNPWIIIIGLMFLMPYAKRIPAYTAILTGTALAASSLLLLVMPSELRHNFGWDVKQWYMTINIIQIIFFAISEMVWSPALMYYTSKVAPPSRKSAYLGIALFPTFMGKVLVGVISGLMLPFFCPEGVAKMIGEGSLSYLRSPEAMWLILFLIAATSPILIIVFRHTLPKEQDA